MNASMLKNMTYVIFAFMALACSSVYGQGSGLPGGVTPVVHLKAEDGATLVVDYASYYYNYHWNWVDAANSSLVFVHSTSSYDNPASSSSNVNRIDEDGYQAIQVKYSAGFRIDPGYMGTGTSIGANLGGDFDIFIVKGNGDLRFEASGSNSAEFFWSMNRTLSTCETGDRRAWAGASLASNQNRRQLMGMSVENGIISLMHNGKVLNRSSSSSNSIQVLNAIDFYANSYDIVVNMYEVLVFKKLNAADYAKVQQYLLGKYSIEPDLPKTGLTLWVCADKGVTTDTTGNVTNIKDHSPTNATYRGGYGYVSGDGSMLFWDSNKSVPQQQAVGYYSCRGFDGSFVNGKEAEFFAVIYSQDNQYYDREILNFSGQRTLFSWSNPTLIKESFGRRPGDVVSMNDSSLSLNNKSRLYNVSVGGGYWEAYINKVLLRKDSYSLTENLSINSFNFGRYSSDLGNPSKGGLHEILLYNRKLSETERTQVKDYLMAKHGLN